jgi:hypothetical protein
MPVKNVKLIENDELAGMGEEGLTVGSLSEAAASMGSMFVPGDVVSEEEEVVTCTPGQTQLPLA